MDRRIKYLNKLLAAYAAGDFDKRLKLSDRLDDTDAVFSALHMMAEEIKAVTISRDHFNAIFNAMNDMALVLSPNGYIEDLNESISEQLGYRKEGLLGRSVNVLCGQSKPSLWGMMKSRRGLGGLVRIWDRSFLTVKGDLVPVEITARPLPLQGTWGKGAILLLAQDIRARLDAENRLLRAEIEGREMERKRLALDLHDGMGQHLMSARFLLGAAQKDPDEEGRQDKIRAAAELLTEVQGLIQGICNALVSKTLEDFGLVPAVRELSERLNRTRILRVTVEKGRSFPVLPLALAVDLFRVIQEFATNAIRHGAATLMKVLLGGSGAEVELRLTDNGKGFEPTQVQGQGMGLRNMHSRVRSHQGVFLLQSAPGKGTEGRIQVSINS